MEGSHPEAEDEPNLIIEEMCTEYPLSNGITSPGPGICTSPTSSDSTLTTPVFEVKSLRYPKVNGSVKSPLTSPPPTNRRLPNCQSVDISSNQDRRTSITKSSVTELMSSTTSSSFISEKSSAFSRVSPVTKADDRRHYNRSISLANSGLGCHTFPRVKATFSVDEMDGPREYSDPQRVIIKSPYTSRQRNSISSSGETEDMLKTITERRKFQSEENIFENSHSESLRANERDMKESYACGIGNFNELLSKFENDDVRSKSGHEHSKEKVHLSSQMGHHSSLQWKENEHSFSHSHTKYTQEVSCSKSLSQQSQRMTKDTGNITISPIQTPSLATLDDLDSLTSTSTDIEVEKAVLKYSQVLSNSICQLKSEKGPKAVLKWELLNNIIRKSWAVPTHGHDLGNSLCTILRHSGGLDLLINNFSLKDDDLQFSCAKVLEQSLTTENRNYIVQSGLDKVVNVACWCTSKNDVEHARIGTGILEHLFKHSEGACGDVVKMGGLDAVLDECRKNDIETLRHCASALANLSLYGGSENQQAMIKRKAPMWLFPLAFHNDDNIKYYACLAISALVANKEIEADVIKSGTLDLVEPFISSHSPSDFANSTVAYAHGQSKQWLQKLVPVLSSDREEARNLATFHFAMEAGIKKKQGCTNILHEIGAVLPLKQVASSPNAIASKYAAEALRLIGEEVPHKLSQQVPLWSVEDVKEWVKQIGFEDFAGEFNESRVDGDILLQLTEDMLKNDIKISNGIIRKRFMRELNNLKKMADYSSCDPSDLNQFLQSIELEYSIYLYRMLNNKIDREMLKTLSEEQLLVECGVVNSIHRGKILDAIRNDCNLISASEETLDKNLDVFISYRRSNGSQLASLLKVHMQLRGFSVFIDVERLEAGKFDNNLLNSIRQAKNFLLVLTPGALDRCLTDNERKDWVHREIVCALESKCNIIPIIDNFQWPDVEELPEDMKAVCYFNGVRWIHDYQDACVDKLERFMRGEMNSRLDGTVGRFVGGNYGRGDATPGTPSSLPRLPAYNRTHSNESGCTAVEDVVLQHRGICPGH